MTPQKNPRQDFHILPITPTPLAARATLPDNGTDTTNAILVAVASVIVTATIFFLVSLWIYRRRLTRRRVITSQFVAVERKDDLLNHVGNTAPDSPAAALVTDEEKAEEKRLSTVQKEGSAQGVAEGYTYKATKNAQASEKPLPELPRATEELKLWGKVAKRVLGTTEGKPSRRSADVGLEGMSEIRLDKDGSRSRSLSLP